MKNPCPHRALVVLLLAAALLLAGCSALLPRGDSRVMGPWQSFEEAQALFDGIVPYETTVADLKGLGLDLHATPNVTILTYSDVLSRFIPSPAIDAADLDSGVANCIRARTACRGFELEQRYIKRKRHGSFLADFLNFNRKVETIGWHFVGLLLIRDEVVIYKLVGGQPLIHQREDNLNPLGPLQGIGESAARGAF